MKHVNQTDLSRGPKDETGAPAYRDRPQNRQYVPRRYGFIEDSCMARAMERL